MISNIFYQMKNSFVIIPISLMLFFIYKKFIIKEKDRLILSDTIVVAVLLILTVSLYSVPVAQGTPLYSRVY